MKRETAELAAAIVDRVDKLEKTLLELQNITNKKSYKILAYDNINQPSIPIEVKLEEYSIAKEVFSQDILEYYINTLNLELEEELKKLEELT